MAVALMISYSAIQRLEIKTSLHRKKYFKIDVDVL